MSWSVNCGRLLFGPWRRAWWCARRGTHRVHGGWFSRYPRCWCGWTYDHNRCGTSLGCAAPVAYFDPANCPAEQPLAGSDSASPAQEQIVDAAYLRGLAEARKEAQAVDCDPAPSTQERER